jgi:hypothetical protein
MQNQDFDLRIVTDLLNTGETLGQKVRPLRSFEPGLPLPLVQYCMQCAHIVKAKFWENIFRKAYGFSSGLAIPNHFQLEESRAVGQTLRVHAKVVRESEPEVG